MIRFRCRQCEKTFERPNEAAGTLVFCTCGAGNRVPWDSILPEPVPSAESGTSEADEQPFRMEPPHEEAPSRSRYASDRPSVRMRDPNYCFNHQTVATQQACESCNEVFCPACLVSLQGQTLCGPCKNLRLRLLQKPPRMSTLAVVALVVALTSAPIGMFCLSPMGVVAGIPALGYVGLLFPLITLVLGGLALREIETNPQVGGRAIAISSVVTALVSGFMIVVITEGMGRQM